MISIIICNRKPELDTQLSQNIQKTVGVEYEVVSIDNSTGQYSIFQAYNEGVARSKGDIICFMHDDVHFLEKGWGRIVEQVFNADDTIGAIGVDGGHFMPDCPCSWTTCHTTSFKTWRTNPDGTYTEYNNKAFSDNKSLVEVASIDGLWMCIRQSLFNTIRFDDKTFSGFHCYDSDICMQILTAGYRIMMTYDIDIVHDSHGTYNEQFFKSIELWHKKWHRHLPVVRGIELSEREQHIHQLYAIELMERLHNDAKLYARLNSPEYRLGHFLLKPYRFLKRKTNR